MGDNGHGHPITALEMRGNSSPHMKGFIVRVGTKHEYAQGYIGAYSFWKAH